MIFIVEVIVYSVANGQGDNNGTLESTEMSQKIYMKESCFVLYRLFRLVGCQSACLGPSVGYMQIGGLCNLWREDLDVEDLYCIVESWKYVWQCIH